MNRGKTLQELRTEWLTVPRDWCSIYQWPRIVSRSYAEDIATIILSDFDQIRINTEGLRENKFARTVRLPPELNSGVDQITEKRFVHAMVSAGYIPGLGKVIGYEVPFKASKYAPHGKIDLLCRSQLGLLIVEVKKYNSTESLLKAILEAFCYARLVAAVGDSFLRAFGINENIAIVPTVLTFEGATSGAQLKTLDNFPQTKALIDRLNLDLRSKGIDRLRFLINTDLPSVFNGCLDISAEDEMIIFKNGYVPEFLCVEYS